MSLETASSSKKKRKVKSMFPLSAIADSKSKTVTREECIELARMIYGRVLKSLNDSLYPALWPPQQNDWFSFCSRGRHSSQVSSIPNKVKIRSPETAPFLSRFPGDL